jgi:hypothetical protein
MVNTMTWYKAAVFGALSLGSLLLYLFTSSSEELLGPIHFLFILAVCFAFHVVWDLVFLKEADTYQQIIMEKNIAYAIHLLIPSLLCLAAAASL